MTLSQEKNQYKDFIGIDVGKFDLTANIYGQPVTKVFKNDKRGFYSLFCWIKKLAENPLIVLEHTGGYEAKLADYLLSKDSRIHLADAKKVKSFIKSYGISGKTDAVDAKAIALYAHERHKTLVLFQKPNSDVILLQNLVARREDLKKILVAEKNRFQAPTLDSGIKQSVARTIKFMQKEMQEIEKKINKSAEKNKEFAAKKEVMQQVAGVGEHTANALLASLPELGAISGNQIASLGGLAPHPKDSGKKSGYRSIKAGGRRNVRQIMFLAALGASKTKTKLGDFYRKLIKNGKKPIVAIAALARKILVIINAKLRDFLVTGQMQGAST